MGVDKNSSLISINKTEFGTLKNGTVVYKYTLENKIGTKVSIITYGGIITNLKTFNKSGALEDIVLGYNSLEEYTKESPYFGAIVGRYGNRISKGKFSINGKEYNLARNDGQNHLHGGNIGFDKVIWDATTQIDKNSASLILSYTSRDMEEGYPGNLETKVIYTLNNENSIEVLYEAITDKPTIINLTQHSYFNLSGDFSESILDHEVKINANAFLPVDKTLIPTGEIVNVESTPFDFREFKRIGKDIDLKNEQLIIGNGYDH
ncbi:MAG: aldose epimerase family protein, partial [Bacteroidota bacterium]|nr:aldose epimerase family protein [Bacteroidota bacterium]